MNPTWRYQYLTASSSITALDAVFISARNPYGDRFLTVVAPSLVLLVALLWSLTRVAPAWRLVGMLSDLGLGASMIGLYRREDFASFAPTVLLVVWGHALLLWFLSSGYANRSTIIVTHGAVLFVTLFGLYVQFKGIAILLTTAAAPTTPAFLFWSPLGAAILWAGAVAFGRDSTGQIIMVCAITEIGIGFFDVSSFGIRWAIPAGLLAWASALCVAGLLAARWHSPTASSQKQQPGH